MNLIQKLLFAAAGILCCGAVHSQDPKKWDVGRPNGSFKEVSFTVQEGTWMNLDVSPDGKEMIFDLLGDIYSLPIQGGTARVLRGGNEQRWFRC
jgi:hypothetical protein